MEYRHDEDIQRGPFGYPVLNNDIYRGRRVLRPQFSGLQRVAAHGSGPKAPEFISSPVVLAAQEDEAIFDDRILLLRRGILKATKRHPLIYVIFSRSNLTDELQGLEKGGMSRLRSSKGRGTDVYISQQEHKIA